MNGFLDFVEYMLKGVASIWNIFNQSLFTIGDFEVSLGTLAFAGGASVLVIIIGFKIVRLIV